jgi:hypothetical protein
MDKIISGVNNGSSKFPRKLLPIKFHYLHKNNNADSFIIIDARIGWLLVLVMLCSYSFITNDDFWTFVPTITATVSCMIALACAGYGLLSFFSIVVMSHLISYPFAAWLNLLLVEPAVRWDLWVHTDWAMWACTVGMLGMALGCLMVNIFNKGTKLFINKSDSPPSKLIFNIILASLFVPSAIGMLLLGIYFHGSIADYSAGGKRYVYIFAVLRNIAFCGVLLQTYRFTKTRSLKDAFWALALCLLPIILFLPSGMRGAALGYVPLIILSFCSWETSNRRKFIILAASGILMVGLISGLGFYRNIKDIEKISMKEKYQEVYESSMNVGVANLDWLRVIVGRLSDYVAVGVIVHSTPNEMPFRGSEGMEDWWQVFIPGFLNIIPDRIEINEGAEICDKYGITKSFGGSGSRPAMALGDLFSRWGWEGIILGMIVLGFFLRQLDLLLFRKLEVVTIIFMALTVQYVFSIHSQNLLNLFIYFFREFIVLIIISSLLASIISKQSVKYYNKGKLRHRDKII